ncbi:uncharacterized protein LOC127800461 [Diospyros lotus]|uniref:uncharacterized protein LOC127800461 n=1 Tax=Diospyros lotus TaxID=55363 RepID=UPI00225A5F0F|nr:uncharacterized protein LOC127800461 [Diospyros lotus]
MAAPQNEDDGQAATPKSSLAVGWIEERYQKIKANAETYPYVWGSYIVVYGGFGLWFAYRWRKLRKTEDRVRVLQERLRKLVEAESSSTTTSSSSAVAPPPGPPSTDKLPK